MNPSEETNLNPEELPTFSEMKLKKHMSSPPPGLVFI